MLRNHGGFLTGISALARKDMVEASITKPKIERKLMKIMETSFRCKTITVAVLSMFALVLTSRAAPPSPADVGDAETFGHPALYMGAASGFVTLSTDPCPVATPTPSPVPNGDSFCFQLNSAPALTTYTATDVARIRLPKKATRNVIYPALRVWQEQLGGAPVPFAAVRTPSPMPVPGCDVIVDPFSDEELQRAVLHAIKCFEEKFLLAAEAGVEAGRANGHRFSEVVHRDAFVASFPEEKHGRSEGDIFVERSRTSTAAFG